MERAHKLAVLVGVLALVLAVLWLWDSGRGERAAQPRSPQPLAVEEAPPPTRVPSPPSERVAPGQSEASGEESVAPAPVPGVAVAPATPRSRLEIEVVEATLVPATGVHVLLQHGRQVRGRTSDARGRVAFDGADLEGADALHPARVRAQVVGREPAWVPVDRPTPPGEPLRLVLPPHGALDVQVLTPEGLPVSQALVELSLVGEPRAGRVSAWNPDQLSAPLVEGHARFPCVELDLQLELRVESWSGLGRAEALVDGPTFAGELVEHALELGRERTILAFRALDDAGRALTGSLGLNTEIRYGTGYNTRGAEVTADEEGRFEWALDVAWTTGERRAIELRAEERKLSARVDLSRSFPPGRVDMGDVVLRPLPVVASGRVVDPQGRAVPGVTVCAWRPADAPSTLEPGFVPAWNLAAETAADGTFALHGELARGPVELRLRDRNPRAVPLRVALGATDVELVAQPTGTIAGRLLLDPGIRLRHPLDVSVHPDSALELVESMGGAPGRRAREAPGAFAIEGLLPGAYTLTVTAHEPLFEVRGLLVASGEVARDPRIQEIDLRGRLHSFTLVLVPPTGSKELEGLVTYTPAGASAPALSCDLRGTNNTVELLTTSPRIDATVRAAGCRLERLSDLGPRTEVHLRTGLCVRLSLPAELLPPAPLALGATLVDAAGERAGASHMFFDRRGELCCFVPAPGRYEVSWLLERRDAGGGSSASIEIGPPQFVDVLDEDAEQRVALGLTPEALARALEAR